jgi:hypothetical protein
MSDTETDMEIGTTKQNIKAIMHDGDSEIEELVSDNGISAVFTNKYVRHPAFQDERKSKTGKKQGCEIQ